MQTFYAVVHQEDDSAFGISFPDLDGCFSAADEEAEIIPRAQEALALYFEDAITLPRPSSIAAIRQIAEVADDLAAGAFLLAVPFIKPATAASALTQSKSKETTSAKVASAAAKVMKDPKASKDAKSAAASALTQKTKKK